MTLFRSTNKRCLIEDVVALAMHKSTSSGLVRSLVAAGDEVKYHSLPAARFASDGLIERRY